MKGDFVQLEPDDGSIGKWKKPKEPKVIIIPPADHKETERVKELDRERERSRVSGKNPNGDNKGNIPQKWDERKP